MESESSQPESERLLGLSESLLHHLDFSGCRKYALQAQKSDPLLPGCYHILAVADVLLASETRINNHRDWYAILQLDRHSEDSALLRNHYKKLLLLLNPNKNKFKFADEAFKLVRNAWAVLSNPTKKSLYDSELSLFAEVGSVASMKLGGKRSPRIDKKTKKRLAEEATFWTACPYCYYVYEYPRAYVDCCLRCQNCRRAFQGVVIPSPPPVVSGTDQYFCCFGFFPLGFSGGAGVEVRERSGGVEGNLDDEDGFVGVSVDKKGSGVNVNIKNPQAEEEGYTKIGDGADGVNVVMPPPMKNKKTVARNTRKLMGKGTKSKGHVTEGDAPGVGILDLNVEAGKEVGEGGVGSIGGTESGSGDGGFVVGGVEFFDGIDDIFVGLPILGDGGNAKVKAS